MKKNKLLLRLNLIFIACFFIALCFKIPQRIYNKIKKDNPKCLYELQNFKFHYEKECMPSNIIMFGNSLIKQGDWNKILKRNDVINRGISGDRTECMCQRLRYLEGSDAKIWFIEGGINDINAGRTAKSILNNYIEIVEFVKTEKAIPVLILTLHINEKAGNKFKNMKNYKIINKKVDELNSLIKNYADQNKIIYINLNTKLLDKEKQLKDEYTTDGVHLTDNAYQIWKEEINKILIKYNLQ